MDLELWKVEAGRFLPTQPLGSQLCREQQGGAGRQAGAARACPGEKVSHGKVFGEHRALLGTQDRCAVRLGASSICLQNHGRQAPLPSSWPPGHSYYLSRCRWAGRSPSCLHPIVPQALLGHFTFSPDPCNSAEYSPTTKLPRAPGVPSALTKPWTEMSLLWPQPWGRAGRLSYPHPNVGIG